MVLKGIESPILCCGSRKMRVLEITTRQASVTDPISSAFIASTYDDVILALSQGQHEVDPRRLLQPGAYVT